MSYNLTSVLYKSSEQVPASVNYKVIFFDEHLVESFESCLINYYDTYAIPDEMQQVHKQSKESFDNLSATLDTVKMIVPVYDFLPKLLAEEVNPDDYTRVEIFNCTDMATYVRKDFLKDNSADIVSIAIESRFNKGDIIFLYEPELCLRELDVVVLVEVDGEYSASYLSREDYHKQLPKPISNNWWGMHQIITEGEFNIYQSIGDKDRPIKALQNVEGLQIKLKHLYYMTVV